MAFKSLADVEAFKNKRDKHFKSHREPGPGRDYRAFVQRYITTKEREAYRSGFDRIFPNAPGAGI